MSELTDDRLLPCPFCGQGFEIDGRVALHGTRASPPCPIRFFVLRLDDPADIAAWNRRARRCTEAVGVKALEWPIPVASVSRLRSGGGLFRYTIHNAPNAFRWAREGGGWSEPFGTLAEAQDAAQADYEARIRSCLTPPTPKVTTDEAEERK